MQENKYEAQKKDKIVQAIYDTLESMKWGSMHDKLAIRVVFRGKLNMLPIEVESRQKR